MNLKIIITCLLFVAVFQVRAQQKDNFKSIFKLTDEQRINKNGFLRYSVLTGYQKNISPIKGLINFGAYTDSISGTRHIFCFNSSIQDMLTKGINLRSKIILEVKDPSKYRYDPAYGPYEDWMQNNTYCYELAMPLSAMKNGNVLMNDLTAILGVKAGYEKRNVKALVLVRTSQIDKILSKGIGERINGVNGKFNNTSLFYMMQLLSEATGVPFLDESKYSDPVDMDLNISSWKDLDTLRLELKRYDLDIKEEMREMEIFVIKEII